MESSTPAARQRLEEARTAIAEGRLDAADHLLRGIGNGVDRNDLDFLRGTVAFRQGDYPSAIHAFRHILDRNPTLLRVRLDLARAYFMAGDDEAAKHHFRKASAAGLPSEVQRKVDAYLTQIRQRRRWSFNLDLGLAPDSNVNAATADDRVTMYGLPFELDPAARKTSGIGISANAAGTYWLPLDRDTRLVLQGAWDELNYKEKQFDLRTVSAGAGPAFFVGQATRLDVLAVGSRRWFGGKGYSRGVGGRLNLQWRRSPRLLMTAGIEAQRMSYDYASFLDGPQISVTAAMVYGLDQVSAVTANAAVQREQARSKPWRNTSSMLSVVYHRQLPVGFDIQLGVAGAHAIYDARLDAFDKARRDVIGQVQFGITNRLIRLAGFSPTLTVTHTRRWSNIALYDFARSRVELGIRRAF